MQMGLLNIEQMILIGSTGRNSGKTTLAVELIKKWKNKFPVIGLKITTIKDKSGKCPRGGHGCGVCTNIKENFELLEENNKTKNKDTSLLLAAGAERVYWLKCLNTHLYDGINHFMNQIPNNALIICESNSLRNAVIPGSFIMLKDMKNDVIKQSASEVINKADVIIENDFENSIKNITEKIEIKRTESDFLIKII
jgi:Molybdopterin-guanine dinucleotide biosynthesis protein